MLGAELEVKAWPQSGVMLMKRRKQKYMVSTLWCRQDRSSGRMCESAYAGKEIGIGASIESVKAELEADG